MKLVLLSGLSGAGKSTAAKIFEDMGYFCIDNIPVSLLSSLLQSLKQKKELNAEERYCFVTDIRSLLHGNGFAVEELSTMFKSMGNFRLVFLEAKNEVLLSRYKQSRRNHPLAEKCSLLDAIIQEKYLLSPLREHATDIIDTSELSPKGLRDFLLQIFDEGAAGKGIPLYIQSFGFKYGIPLDSDLVSDARFIPNPFYLEELRPLNGKDELVRDYIFSFPETNEFLQKELASLLFLLPYYQREGKIRLNYSIGCTGGHHRSVAFAERLREVLEGQGVRVILEHRDMSKEAVGGA